LPIPQPTAVETFLRGVSRLRTLSFNVNSYSVVDCIPELDHAILVIFLLPLLVDKTKAHSLKMITISDSDLQERERGTETLDKITSMVKDWEKH